MRKPHSTATPALPALTAALVHRLECLPPALSIAEISAIWKKKTSTIRQQIARGVFPLRVQHNGAEQFVALADLLRFYQDGNIQSQPQTSKKAGRPTNKARAAAAQQHEEGG